MGHRKKKNCEENGMATSRNLEDKLEVNPQKKKRSWKNEVKKPIWFEDLITNDEEDEAFLALNVGGNYNDVPLNFEDIDEKRQKSLDGSNSKLNWGVRGNKTWVVIDKPQNENHSTVSGFL